MFQQPLLSAQHRKTGVPCSAAPGKNPEIPSPEPQDFGRNYAGDPKVKIPWVRRDLSGGRILVMEWIDGLRCTDPVGIQSSGIDVNEFIRCGVVSGLRQLLEVRLLCWW